MKKRTVPVCVSFLAVLLLCSGRAFAAASNAGDQLSGLNRKIYDLVKAEVMKVAAGERTSTKFDFSLKDLGLEGKSWTCEELGISPFYNEKGNFTDECWADVEEKLYKKIGYDADVLRNMFQIIRRDCLLESIWMSGTFSGEVYYDANSGEEVSQYKWSFHSASPSRGTSNLTQNNGVIRFIEDDVLHFEFAVTYRYGAPSDDGKGKYYFYTDPDTVRGAIETVEKKAKSIVAANAGKSDYDKLNAYREAICSLVSYNYDALNQGTKGVGMDPWNIYYVFDGDSATNVVCEGYAKAFQYLCELSTFNSHIKSYLISGNSQVNALDPDAHMWNHVEIDGRYWLVDLTGCDTNPQNDDLFLKAPAVQNENASRRYAFSHADGSRVGYSDIANYYNNDRILNLDSMNYAPGYYLPCNSICSYNDVASYFSSHPGNKVRYTAAPTPDGWSFDGWSGLEGVTFVEGDASTEKVVFIMPDRALMLTSLYHKRTSPDKVGQAAGSYLSTDIVTMVNGGAIESVNVGGRTLISAEDLAYHGFSVSWDGAARALRISKSGSPASGGAAVKKSDEPVGTVLGNYYYTDIVTYLDGSVMEAYNTGGRTYFCAEDMGKYGYTVTWDAASRTLSVTN